MATGITGGNLPSPAAANGVYKIALPQWSNCGSKPRSKLIRGRASPGADAEDHCAGTEQVLRPKRSTADMLGADLIHTSFNLTAA